MDTLMLAVQQKLMFISSMQTLGGGRDSKENVLSTYLDDNDDDDEH